MLYTEYRPIYRILEFSYLLISASATKIPYRLGSIINHDVIHMHMMQGIIFCADSCSEEFFREFGEIKLGFKTKFNPYSVCYGQKATELFQQIDKLNPSNCVSSLALQMRTEKAGR